MKPRSLVPDLVAAASAIVGARVVAGDALTRGFPVDDAWIHMVYGLALRTEGSLAYNDGAPATGSTSPPWALVAALAHVCAGAHGPSMTAALALKVIGVVLHAACAVLAARLAAACVTRVVRVPASLGAGLLVGLSPVGAYSAVSGMEVPLASALLLAAFLAIARRRPRLAGLAVGLAAATRPEAILVAPFVALSGEGLRARLEIAVAASLPPAALALRSLAVSGRPLPATFYQKARPLHLDRVDVELRLVVDYMLDELPPYGASLFAAFVLAALALGALAILRRDARGSLIAGLAATSAVVWLVAMAVTVHGVSPRAFYYQRYFAPPLPLLAVAVVVALARLGDALARLGDGLSRLGDGLSRLVAARLGAAPTWVRPTLIAMPVVVLLGEEAARLELERARYAGDVAAIDAVQVTLGRLVAERVPEGGVVWSQDAGAPRYFGRRKVVDLCRLNTPELLRAPELAPELAPSLVVLAPSVFDVKGALELVLAAAPRDSNDRHARQVALRCEPGAQVEVAFRGARIASAPCAR